MENPPRGAVESGIVPNSLAPRAARPPCPGCQSKYNRTVGEFELIDRFFTRGPRRDDVRLGIGDDAALVDPGGAGSVVFALASASAENAGETETDATALAHDLVCTAFNRLAARGVAPAWSTLALSLPEPREDWIQNFSNALFATASPCGAVLIGGDTTRGPLTATLVAHGATREPTEDRPPAPKAGNAVYMTGALGRQWTVSAGTAPAEKPVSRQSVLPRVDAGIAAWDHVSAAAAIDASLAATLNDLLEPFGLGAEVEGPALPVAEGCADIVRRRGGVKLLAETAADPELCFIVAPERAPAFCRAMETTETPYTRIGAVAAAPGIRIRDVPEAGV